MQQGPGFPAYQAPCCSLALTPGMCVFIRSTIWLCKLASETLTRVQEGPVHDVQWAPEGGRFCVIAGYMPAQVGSVACALSMCSLQHWPHVLA